MARLGGRGAAALVLALAGPGLSASTAHSQGSAFSFHVRRSVAFGQPLGGAHHAGIGQIVWGEALRGSAVTVTLEALSGPRIERTTLANPSTGAFVAAMDHPIAAGDVVTVTVGGASRGLSVPRLEAVIDPATGRVAGWGPAGVALEGTAGPKLAVRYQSAVVAIDTDGDGYFAARFPGSVRIIPGLSAELVYTTPGQDMVHSPIMPGWPFARGVDGDGWADVVLGQPDFGEITPNAVTSDRVFNPGGIVVDRSRRPNRVFVYDGGNSRVLGMAALGRCAAGDRQGEACTTDGDCGETACAIDPLRPADLVLGQPSMATSTCNGDGGWQAYPDVPPARADTLCGLREEQMSISEGGSAVSMAVDDAGNLYVPDLFNNRILRYDQPFETDTVADAVWGQADFAGITCNRGRGDYLPSVDSLCLGPRPGQGNAMSGVAIDAQGAMWVADMVNNRVLRFPYAPALGRPTALPDLVLGQPSFTSWSPPREGFGLDGPSAVQVDAAGSVYVPTWTGGQLVAFDPPFSSGMPISRVLATGLQHPTGLGMAPDGALWVNEAAGLRYLRYVEGRLERTVYGYEWGGLGLDDDGNLLAAGWLGQSGVRFAAPAFTDDAPFLGRGWRAKTFNGIDDRGLGWGYGIEITGEQLVVGDGQRLRFWNDPASVTTHQPHDGAITAADAPHPRQFAPDFLRMRADALGWLWVVRGSNFAEVRAYALPLVAGAEPVKVLRSPLPLAGGGTFDWTPSLTLSGVAVQPGCDCLWLSDRDANRAFRVRDAHGEAVVDLVLGQPDASGRSCNRGQQVPAADTLCAPGGLAFDPAGNLFVADHNLEFEGNHRLVVFDSEALAGSRSRASFGPAARWVLGRGGDFTRRGCLPPAADPLCGPWEPGFDPFGLMAVGQNGYMALRFPLLYREPLAEPLPFAGLGDFHSMPTTSRFDVEGNLYVLDHNRGRVLVYKGPIGAVPLPEPGPPPTAMPARATGTSTPTATPDPTPSIALTPPATPTTVPTHDPEPTSPAPAAVLFVPRAERAEP